MKSYLDLVGQYAKVHKKKNKITIVCIAISVCLVTAIFGMADMEIRTRKISAINEYGNYHVFFKNIDDETAKLIGNRPDIEVSGWVQRLKNGKLRDKPLAIIGGEEAIDRELGVNINKGHFPKNSHEALLDKVAMEQFNISLGDEVPITLSDGRINKYTIVGIYEDFSILKKQDIHGLFLSDEEVRKITNKSDGRCYYVQFKKAVNMRNAIDEIKTKFKLTNKQVSENDMLLGLIGQSRNSYMMKLYKTAAVLVIMVLIAGVLMIASSFNMSVLERIQFFGMMRCLGASKKQVKRFVLLEAIQFSLKGIPIGLAIGTIIVWVSSAFLKYVNPIYFSDMPLFGISWPSLITGIVVGFLTVIFASLSPCKKASKVSPLSAVTGNINQNNVLQSKTAVKTKHLRIDIAMGIHHAFIGKKNILLMTGSFAISIILFLSFSVMIDFMHQALKPLRPYTPDISIVSKNNTCSLDTKLLEKLKDNTDIKRVYGRMFAYNVPIISNHKQSKINLISYEKNQFNWTKKQLTHGSIDKVEIGEEVLVVYSQDLPWKIDDSITLKFSKGDKKVKIAGILSDSPFDREKGTQTVICSEKLFRSLTGENGYTIIDMQLNNDADDDTVSKIRSLTTSQMVFSDQRQSNEEGRAMFYSFAIFVYGFLLLIASITVFNIINSINMSITSRMNQYGIMRAVGMATKQLHRLILAEASTYAVCGCFAGCILGLPLHKLVFNLMITSRWSTKWQFPYAALVFIIGIAIFATLLSVIGPVKKISKMDIVNVVNAE